MDSSSSLSNGDNFADYSLLSSSPPTLLPEFPGPQNSFSLPSKCGNCILCATIPPPCLRVRSPSWGTILEVALFALHHKDPNEKFFLLQTAIYPFIQTHWRVLGLSRKNTLKWKKQILDALSHGSDVFATGRKALHKKGYWGLKNLVDPWAFPRNLAQQEEKSYPPSYIRKFQQQWTSLARAEALGICNSDLVTEDIADVFVRNEFPFPNKPETEPLPSFSQFISVLEEANSFSL